MRLAAVLALALLLPACAPSAERRIATWSYAGTPIPAGWWYARAGVPEAVAKGATGKAVTIAFVDTGVLPAHEDLPTATGAATCGPDPTSFADKRGHGTQMAGIALGKNPGHATRGVAPAASLLAIKVDCGLVTPGPFTQGIDRAIQARPAVVVLALGGYPPNAAALLRDRVPRNRDILFVVASVWDGVAEPFPDWTRSDNALVVAAMTLAAGDKEVPYDGRRGDIAAPGRDVETADIGLDPARPGMHVQHLMQGTSAAAAIVAGCAALVKEKVGLGATAIKTALISAAEPSPGLYAKRLNCGKAIP